MLTSKIGRNIKNFAKIFANDDHYLRADENFPNIPPENINDSLNGKLLTDGLDLEMVNLSKYTSALNFIGPPTNPADHTHQSILNR